MFLLHNVHTEGTEIFESRWAMSYLRGPLSRAQIKSLTARVSAPGPAPAGSAPAAAAAPPSAAASAPVPAPAEMPWCGRPVLPPQVPQFFLPVRAAASQGGRILYRPRLLGGAQVRYANPRLKVDLLQEVMVMTEITDSAVPVDWEAAEELTISANELQKAPTDAVYAPCAPAAGNVKNYAAWARDFTAWLQNSRKLTLLRSPSLNQFCRAGEEERDFRIRLQQIAREQRDAAAEQLRVKYAPKLGAMQERLRRAEAAKEREASQATRAKFDTVVSFGSTLLGAFLGRKAVSTTTLGKAATSIRSAGRAMDQAGDVNRAQETVESVQTQLKDLESQFQAEVDALGAAVDPATEALESIELRPTRTNINVRLVALVWLPFSRDALGVVEKAEF